MKGGIYILGIWRTKYVATVYIRNGFRVGHHYDAPDFQCDWIVNVGVHFLFKLGILSDRVCYNLFMLLQVGEVK